MHYDLEVSGFPSSHAGHLVLLGLKDQDYPGTKRLEDWPTWDLPILKWARAQGAVVGFAHSGWGLEVKSSELPNYEMPGFDGIGANEFIVDVTHPEAVDFISAGRHAVRVGAEHLVPHAERRLPHPHQRRDGLSLHHRRQGRPGALLCEGGWPADVPQVARRRPRRAELRVRRQDPPDGLRRQRHARRHRRERGEAERARTSEGDGDRSREPGRCSRTTRCASCATTRSRTGTSSARASGTHAKCRSR